MECQDVSTSYEDLRRRNIQRNENMMRSLGLCVTRGGATTEVKTRRSLSIRTCISNDGSKPRRSARIASNVKTLLKCDEVSLTGSPTTSSVLRGGTRRGAKQGRDGRSEEDTESKVEKGRASTMDREEQGIMEKDFCSSDSSGSEYPVELNNDGENTDLNLKSRVGTSAGNGDGHVSASLVCADALKSMTATTFGATFQELVIRALMQSTDTLIGPSPSVKSPLEVEPTEGAIVSNGAFSRPSTWNEAAYNIATAQRKRKPPMTRTSAGEDSDSQEEFPIPADESPQAKSVRTRRLNRSRARKAKELTSNRKAMKKVPYVLNIDGTGKAKGIHRHLWRAAVRGQCRRLDPTMDNINHHPKHVVDSIWHALEKEWEFEGFAHRAREMFEKAATKFMRNRKMQLKTKFKKKLDGPKPNDVNDVYWKKIKNLTKESHNHAKSTESIWNVAEGKQSSPQVLQERSEMTQHFQVSGTQSSSRTLQGLTRKNSPVREHEENVDARIKNLMNEIMELQNSMKFRNLPDDEADRRKARGKDKVVSVGDVDTDFEGTKENMMPGLLNGNISSELNPGNMKGKGVEEVDHNAPYAMVKNKLPTVLHAEAVVNAPQGGQNLAVTEVECGDVVSLLSVDGGRREEIGKAVVMGLAGSKILRKVIPKGWHLVKVYTYTAVGALQVCPFPAGWAEQLKHKTVKDAEGRNILWPDSSMCT